MPQLHLRGVDRKDEAFVLRVANDPVTRAMSLDPHSITPEEHRQWFEEQLARKMPFYIAEHQGSSCGYARFSGSGGEMTVSIALAPEYRGKGLACLLLEAASQTVFAETQATCLHAYVKSENNPSLRAFIRARFMNTSPAEADIYHLTLKRPDSV